MEEAFDQLVKLKTEIDNILELESSGKSNKELLDKLLNFSGQAVSLITIFDKEKIEEWKKNDKYSFLHFVPFFKNFLLIINNYTEKIEPSLKHFYTDEIAIEIDSINQEIKRAQEELNPDFEQISLKEKEQLEREYNNLQLLLKERDELIKKNNMLKSFDIDGIKTEIKDLTKSAKNIKAKIEPLKAEKAELEISLKNFADLNKEVDQLKNSQEQSSELLMAKIDSSIQFIKNKHLHWQQNKEVYINRLEEEVNNLAETETKIKNYLAALSSYRESIVANKEIMEKHFNTDKKIAGSLPEIKGALNFKIERLQQDLNKLDLEIQKFLEVNQKISDEITRNPITFDYL
jgi:chromosome segregation ATPase